VDCNSVGVSTDAVLHVAVRPDEGLAGVLCAWMYGSSLRRRSETEVKMPRARRSRAILADQSSIRFSER